MRIRMSLVPVLFAANLFLSSCEDSPTRTTGPPPPEQTDFAFVLTTDFQTGSASVIWFDGSYTTQTDVVSVHSDAVARFADGLIYVVNRLGADNIQVVDPAAGFSTRRQFSVEPGSDPHDIAVASKTKAYVTRYNKTDLWIVDPSAGTQTGSISLASYADDDGIPEMDRLAIVDGHLFVSIQRLDRNNNFMPVGTSFVAVVDVAADTLVDVDPLSNGIQPIVLAAANPFSDFELLPATNTLLIADSGVFGVQDGGVDAFDTMTFDSRGLMLTEQTVGGDVTDVEILGDDSGVVIMTDANFHNSLLAFDPRSGTVTDTLYAPGAFVLQDVEGTSNTLLLTDRTATNAGIRIYDAASGAQVLAGPLDVGLPPFDITVGSVVVP